jgi:hypothetical protein
MTRYLISFPNDGMDHIPEEEMPDVADAAHAVVQEAQDAGVYIFTGGLDEDVDPVIVAGDGTVTAGTYPLGGITVIDVPSREAAMEWPRRSRPPAAVRKRSARSCSTRSSDRTSPPMPGKTCPGRATSTAHSSA